MKMSVNEWTNSKDTPSKYKSILKLNLCHFYSGNGIDNFSHLGFISTIKTHTINIFLFNLRNRLRKQ